MTLDLVAGDGSTCRYVPLSRLRPPLYNPLVEGIAGAVGSPGNTY
jgi:hypothetical protein